MFGTHLYRCLHECCMPPVEKKVCRDMRDSSSKIGVLFPFWVPRCLTTNGITPSEVTSGAQMGWCRDWGGCDVVTSVTWKGCVLGKHRNSYHCFLNNWMAGLGVSKVDGNEQQLGCFLGVSCC